MQATAPTKPKPRAVGRPRRLTLDSILDVVEALGLGTFEMAQVADRLGVGVSTIYGYVPSREALARLATERHVRRALVTGAGQSWQDVLREQAATVFNTYTSSPEMLIETLRGAFDPDTERAYRERIVALLTGYGLSAEAAVRLYHEVNQLASGAAVVRNHRALSGAETAPGEPGCYERALQRLVAEQEALFAQGKG